MLTVGSLYGHGFDPPHRAALEDLGFTLRPQTSNYAGSQLCSFIDFRVGPALELVEVTDRSDYESFVPPGMAPYCPGISLVVPGGSPASVDSYASALADHEPYRLKVAYAGGAAADAPGWHYLNFGRPLVDGTFIWLTAFDDPKPEPTRIRHHANGVQGVIGLVFDLDPDALGRLARLSGQPIAGATLNVGAVAMLAAGADGQRARRFPLSAVVLKAHSLDSFKEARDVQQTRFMGGAALRVETNPLAWDLLITT